jgi:hypothetical protein
METNVWFYTFSTSAQVMAALAGLFAVFVVYKIQDFDELYSSAREKCIRGIIYASSYINESNPVRREDLLLMDDREVLSSFNTLYSQAQDETEKKLDTSHVDFTIETFLVFQKLILKKESIVRQLKTILTISFGAVAWSLSAIVFTSSLIHYKVIILGSLIFFLICLYVVGRGVYVIAIK